MELGQWEPAGAAEQGEAHGAEAPTPQRCGVMGDGWELGRTVGGGRPAAPAAYPGVEPGLDGGELAGEAPTVSGKVHELTFEGADLPTEIGGEGDGLLTKLTEEGLVGQDGVDADRRPREPTGGTRTTTGTRIGDHWTSFAGD